MMRNNAANGGNGSRVNGGNVGGGPHAGARGTGTRTRYSSEFKAQVVLEVLTGVKTSSEACRAYNLKYESLNRWRNHFLENARQLFETGQTDQEQTRIGELERMSIRGWHLGRSLDGELTVTALRRALLVGAPQIHHSDQGVQYAAGGYVERLNEVGTAISMAEVGEAWQNGYAERLMRTIKEEEVALSEYTDYNDAYGQIGKFLDEVYQHKRIHSSLGYLTPAEFEQSWRDQQFGEGQLLLP